jgi:aspartyl/asparaginyl-tRNA synthetase
MTRIHIADLRLYYGRQVIVPCWIYRRRELKNRTFVTIRDGWTTGQALAEDQRSANGYRGYRRGRRLNFSALSRSGRGNPV